MFTVVTFCIVKRFVTLGKGALLTKFLMYHYSSKTYSLSCDMITLIKTKTELKVVLITNIVNHCMFSPTLASAKTNIINVILYVVIDFGKQSHSIKQVR